MKNQFLTLCFLLLFVKSGLASVLILNGLTHTFKARNGQVVKGEVIFINTGDTDENLSFYLNDIVFSCEYERLFSGSLTHKRSSMNWFKGDLTRKSLRPKERFVYRYELEVPGEKEVFGTYWNALMVEVERPIREEALQKNVNVQSKIRYAVGLIVNVETKEDLQLEFENVEFSREEASNLQFLKVELINISEFLENVRVQLEIYDQNGEKLIEKATTNKRIFPDSCADFQIEVTDLPPGAYECILLAESRKQFIGVNISLEK